MKSSIAFFASVLALCSADALAQQAAQPASDNTILQDRITGDLGLGAYRSQRNPVGKSDRTSVLPYAYFDYGRFFARLDTFGVKTVKIGAGYLELATRVAFDGFDAQRGLRRRSDAVPLGIGTYQETPYGAFFLNAFYDVNRSHGYFGEAIYAAQVDAGPVSIYPQLGVERRSASYNDYFLGVSSSESSASGYREYHAGASTNPLLGLSADMPLAGNWKLNFTWRRKWFGNGASNSPIINHKIDDSVLLAVSYHFK